MSSASRVPESPAPLSAAMILLMAVATGLAVASNYYAQPLLHTIGAQFHLSEAVSGSIVTIAQLSYAIGLMLLVPLGDRFEQRGLIVLMTSLSAGGLLISAFAPTIVVLMAGTAITGMLSVVAQVLVPFAATLAAPHERGKAVGIVMSGLLLGILLARTASGVLADLGSWRTVYWVAAILMLAMSFTLWRALPSYRSPNTLSYLRLLGSIFQLYAHEPLLRARSVLGALLFASFSMLWTSLTFLLASPPYSYSNTQIGLIGLVGAAGAYAAKRFGALADSGHANLATRAGLLLLLGSWGFIAFGGHALLPLLAGILIQDLAIQGVHVTNQSTIYRLNPEARSRLTAGYMTSYFIGGASGSLVSSYLYSHFGWTGVVSAGVVLGLLALLYSQFSASARVPETAPSPTMG